MKLTDHEQQLTQQPKVKTNVTVYDGQKKEIYKI